MKPYRLLNILLAGLLALVPAAQALAQYTGPSAAQPPRNVADILKNPIDDQPVVLRGYITRQIAKEKYMFADSSGEIRVEIDDKRFPPQRIDEKTQVELRGEVEKDFMRPPEIDVDSVTILAAPAPAP